MKTKPLLEGVYEIAEVNLRYAKLFGNGETVITFDEKGSVHLNLEGWTMFAPGVNPVSCSAEISLKEFVKQYSASSGISEVEFYKTQVPLPDKSSPSGWAAVSNNPISIKSHVDLNAPDEITLSNPVDFRLLLNKYIEHVGQCEGVDFISEIGGGYSKVPFDAAEIAELEFLQVYPLKSKDPIAPTPINYGALDPVERLAVCRGEVAPVAVPRLEMSHVVRAHMEIPGCPVLTSNQCHTLAMKLNGCLDELKRLNPSL